MTAQQFGRYVVESKLGEGGMGTVYRARDGQLSRTVAIKVLSPGTFVDADRQRRFFQEARAASALNHPNIVTIYDLGTEGDAAFIVMEYVSGSPLDRRLPPHGLPIKEALAVAVKIADALSTAHGAGIVHRDLKPSNVMISDDGVVKVLDFGVAKLLERADPAGDTATIARTSTGTVIGTPAYMSPEQAEGRAVDARSDIFSFGALLYEMVTGKRAFTGASAISVLAKIVNEEPLPPCQLTPGLPIELEKAILRCLRKDPARRYQTMADLKVALEDMADDAGRPSSRAVASAVDARTSNGPLRSVRWIGAVAALVLLSIAGVYFASSRSAPAPQARPTVAVPLTAVSGQVRHPSLSPDSEQVAFSWTGARQDNQDVYVQQIGAGTPLRLTTDPRVDSSPAWSPDGRSIAFLRREPNSLKHELRLVAPLGGPERKIADVEPRNPLYRTLTIAWCPDSSCLIVPDGQGAGQADALFEIQLNGGTKRQLTFPPPQVAIDNDPAISPDEKSLVFRRDFTPFTGEMYRVALTSHMATEELTRLTDRSFSATRPAWLPNSRQVVFSARGGLWRMDAVGGGSPSRLPFGGLTALSLPSRDRAGTGMFVWSICACFPTAMCGGLTQRRPASRQRRHPGWPLPRRARISSRPCRRTAHGWRFFPAVRGSSNCGSATLMVAMHRS